MDDFTCHVQCDEMQAYYDWLAMRELDLNLLTMTEEDWVAVFNNDDYPADHIEDMPF